MLLEAMEAMVETELELELVELEDQVLTVDASDFTTH